MDVSAKKLRTNYILIDYENVQPDTFCIRSDFPFKMYLFLGANQTKIPVELAISMQEFGNNAEYVRVAGVGKNALDFHVAFYLGTLYEKDNTGYFHIISRDSGFDVLIKHLRERKILVQRYSQLNDIHSIKASNSKSLDEKIESVVSSLVSRGNAKPRKLETLKNSINALFLKALSAEELEVIANELVRRKIVIIDNDKIHYNLTE